MKTTTDSREWDWHCESAGRWAARSEKMSADDCILFYRITVEETGLFSLCKSDGILNAGSKMFATLKQAQLAAEAIESQIQCGL